MVKYQAIEQDGIWGVLSNSGFRPMKDEDDATQFAADMNEFAEHMYNRKPEPFFGGWPIYDLDAVNAVFNGLTPRPVAEIMEQLHPQATKDRQGRFHAPHEGYECPFTGQIFRAGEYLPVPEDDYDDRPSKGFGPRRKHPVGHTLDGVKHEWNGTRRQNMAVWAELKRQSDAKRAEEFAQAVHMGTVGEKLTVDVTVNFVFERDGFYGKEYTTIMHTTDRNVVVYKGAKALGKKGDVFTVAGKVKRHADFKGIAQTVIERPKVLTTT